MTCRMAIDGVTSDVCYPDTGYEAARNSWIEKAEKKSVSLSWCQGTSFIEAVRFVWQKKKEMGFA